MRTREELLLLAKQTIQNFNLEFPDLEPSWIVTFIKQQLDAQIETFVHKRLGHLSGADLSRMWLLFIELQDRAQTESQPEDITPEPELIPEPPPVPQEERRGRGRPRKQN